MAIQDFSGEGPKSAIEQIGSLLTGTMQEVQKRKEHQKNDVMVQVKLYATLREAGYSPEDAHSKISRTYRSTGFLENLLGGGSHVFNQPTEEDKVGLERQKTRADIKKTEAETGLATAKKGYYEEGGPKRTVIDKMTPNQLQQRVKYLTSIQGTLDTPEENQNIEGEIKFINERIQETAGYKPKETEMPGDGGTIRVKRRSDGKIGKIPAANFNPKKYEKI